MENNNISSNESENKNEFKRNRNYIIACGAVPLVGCHLKNTNEYVCVDIEEEFSILKFVVALFMPLHFRRLVRREKERERPYC